MKTIDKHIENLLQDYTCVIIPEMGGFITSEGEGYLDAKTNVFHPPFKRILFNKNLTNNDGLLANALVNQDQLSFEEATKLLLEYKDACFAKLDSEGRVEIERVGVLFFDTEKNIQFQQSNKNFLSSSFGLSPKFLSILPIEQEPIVKVQEKLVEVIRPTEPIKNRDSIKPEKTTKEKKKKRRGAVLLPLIILPLLVGGLYVANQMGYVGDQRFQISSINPFSDAKQVVYSPRAKSFEQFFDKVVQETNNEIKVEPTLDNVSDENMIVEPVIEKEVIPEKVDSTYVHTELVEIPEELPYHVVGGCFSVEENAQNLVEQWKAKGKNASIIDKKGNLYRVSLQSFSSRLEANDFKELLQESDDISTWILKK